MKIIYCSLPALVAFCALVGMPGLSHAQTLVTDFNTFFEDALFESWNEPSATIVSGPESYSVTATGYGSNYVYIGDLGILGSGNTHVELQVTLEGPPEADGFLGPIISFVDEDGTYFNYAWYGQTLGSHTLTQPLASPTFISSEGTTPGLDLDTLTHMHMQLDPGDFGETGPYTVEFENLSLIEVETTPGDFDNDGDVDGLDFLAWQRGESPDPMSAEDLDAWQTSYGAGAEAFLGQIQAVPEPGALGLVLVGSACFLLRKRTKNRS